MSNVTLEWTSEPPGTNPTWAANAQAKFYIHGSQPTDDAKVVNDDNGNPLKNVTLAKVEAWYRSNPAGRGAQAMQMQIMQMRARINAAPPPVTPPRGTPPPLPPAQTSLDPDPRVWHLVNITGGGLAEGVPSTNLRLVPDGTPIPGWARMHISGPKSGMAAKIKGSPKSLGGMNLANALLLLSCTPMVELAGTLTVFQNTAGGNRMTPENTRIGFGVMAGGLPGWERKVHGTFDEVLQWFQVGGRRHGGQEMVEAFLVVRDLLGPLPATRPGVVARTRAWAAANVPVPPPKVKKKVTAWLSTNVPAPPAGPLYSQANVPVAPPARQSLWHFTPVALLATITLSCLGILALAIVVDQFTMTPLMAKIAELGTQDQDALRALEQQLAAVQNHLKEVWWKMKLLAGLTSVLLTISMAARGYWPPITYVALGGSAAVGLWAALTTFATIPM